MKEYKKHIVLLTSEFPPLPGGIGNHAYNLAEQLQINGYNVSVIADQRDSSENETKFDAELQSKVFRVKLKKSRFLMYLKRVWLCFKLSKSADILICSGKFPLWIGAVLKPIISSKTMAIIHGTEVNFSNQRLQKSINSSLKRFDKIVAVSNFTNDLVSDLNLKSIKVIPNGFKVSSTTSTLNSEIKGFPKLLTVGNVTERKGQSDVIMYLPELKEKYPDIHYHCVGLRTEAEQFESLAESLDVSEHVTFHGHILDDQLTNFYKYSDICVMLSQTTTSGDVEGFGIALIEANYFGLPTIGSKDCGIEDAIDDNNSGILIDSKNKDEFLNAVNNILNQKEHFTNAAKTWAKAHEWPVIIKKYIEFIES